MMVGTSIVHHDTHTHTYVFLKTQNSGMASECGDGGPHVLGRWMVCMVELQT